MKWGIKYIVFIVVFSYVNVSKAQLTKKITSDNFVWVNDFVKVKLTDKWGLYFDASYRRKEWLKEMNQIKLNPGVTYTLFENTLSVTSGFCYFLTYAPFYNRAEYRPWEQLLLSQKINKHITITNRLRVEQRFNQQVVNNSLTNDFIYNNRYRYQLGLKIPLSTKTTSNDSLNKTKNTLLTKMFIIISDEIMFNSGKEIKYNYFDQNRLTGGLGYKLNNHYEISVTYMNDYIKRNSLDTYENNNVLILNLYQNF
jgi:hypothetical protein